MKHIIVGAVLACASVAALADEADVRKVVEAKLGKVDKISRVPVPGLWEVISNGEIYYVDDKATHFISGEIVDVKSRRNLTNERRKEISSSAIAGALDLAIKQVRGSGKNVLVTFEDPNCGYCKRLAKELQNVKDVTVYTFLQASLGEDSYTKSRGVWCSADRAKTWSEWMVKGTQIPAAGAKCDTAGLDRSIELGRKLRIEGVPALFFANGERVGGAIPAAEIEKRFAAGS